MSSVICTVTDSGIIKALQRLEGFPRQRSVMEEIGQAYERRVLDNFERESDPEGNRWPRLSKAAMLLRLGKGRSKKNGYLSAKGKTYLQSKKILVESGALRSRIHYQAGDGWVRIGVGGSLPYSSKVPAVHQFGTKSAGRGHKVKIPARPYLAMNDGTSLRLAERDRQMIIQIVYRRIRETVIQV